MMDSTRVHEPHVESAAEYVLDGAKHIIETFGPRAPGSEGERKAQEYVRGELEHCADEVRTEPFQVAPKAFMGFIPVVGILLCISSLAYGALS